MPKSEESVRLARLHPAFTYCSAKLDEAIATHQRTPTTENLVHVADIGRMAWNVGASLASDAGMPREPWSDLQNAAREYVQTGGVGIPFPEQNQRTIGLLVDVVYELQRDIRNLEKAVSQSELEKARVA